MITNNMKMSKSFKDAVPVDKQVLIVDRNVHTR